MRDFKDSHFKKLNNELHEKDPDAYYHLHRQIQNDLLKYKRTMFEKEFQLILRVVLQLTDGKVGQFTSPTGKLNYNEGYTGNHIAVFECMLRSPPVFSLIDNTYEQYVLNHRLNFKHWKLVDVDNYMKGNQYYSEFVTADTWNKKIRETWDN